MESYIELSVISSILCSDEIVNFLGMPADKNWNTGDKIENTIMVEKESGWLIRSRKNKNVELDIQINSIINRIKGIEYKFKEISTLNETDVQLSVVIYYEKEPPLFFKKEIITWLSEIGASVDIDLYAI
ncbi:DUF4279 domain-containing protein [Terasakiella pusilla]|uniref:DUF4279 domain-containing protein n=1 Tax=Terasakiella pusilla TaxID=64973 RepID=UPI003AA90E2E